MSDIKPLETTWDFELSKKERAIVQVLHKDGVALTLRGSKGQEHGYTAMDRDGLKRLISVLSDISDYMDKH